MTYLLLLSLFATLSVILAKKPKVTEKVVFDIEIEGEKVGKIEIGLFGKIVPKTVRNFVKLCNKPYGRGYKGSRFYYVEPRSFVQSGFFIEYGCPGRSIYQDSFERENFKLQNYGAGWVGMANDEDRYNNIEFYITLDKIQKFDLINVVFGKVIKGMDVLRTIEKEPTNSYKRPIKTIVIANCTSEIVQKPFAVEKTDATE